MVDLDQETAGPSGAGSFDQPRERLVAALKALLLQHLKDPRLIEDLRKNNQAPIAKVEVEGWTYVVSRYLTLKHGGLTAQQKQIALLVTEGLPNKTIAQRMGIKPSTVSSHLERIYRKLDINSRAALARYCTVFS